MTKAEVHKPVNGPKKCMGRSSIELGAVTQHNVLLNEAVFPVTYNERFYKDVIGSGDLAKLVFFNDCVVGAVCCRLDVKDGEKRLYIMTLGTLAPYRRFGIGGMLLNHVFSLCERDHSIKGIMLHVQVNNDSALNFYEHFGFKKTGGIVENYYKRIDPDSAYVLEKNVNQDN